jgi:hypothetical protein
MRENMKPFIARRWDNAGLTLSAYPTRPRSKTALADEEVADGEK